MAASVRTKVDHALQKFVIDAAAGDKLELEDLPAGKVAGTLVSSAFTGRTHAERQDLIWDELDAALSPYERTRVALILAKTPEEYEAQRESA